MKPGAKKRKKRAWKLLAYREVARGIALRSGPMTGPVLGLDLGARRIGLAVSDPAARIAFPAGHLERSGLEADLAALQALARERGVTRIVVGLPVLLGGREGTGAEAARRFARALEQATGLPVVLVDERLTSAEAERALRQAPARRRRARKQVVDALAATLLLRGYLEQAEPGA
jgi:putative Holliday junction resolvase